MILVPGSNEKIVEVLEEISSTGVFGNFSLVPDSLTTSDIPGNIRISKYLEHAQL